MDHLGEDEPLYKDLLANNTFLNCANPDQIPCREGHPKCYNSTNICIYRIDGYKHLIPCRTGSHLEHCDVFECNEKYKCPGYYCVPWAYVCDGKWDCPRGHDENEIHNCGKERNCVNFFKCKHFQICIHMADICDTINDCPEGDDEFQCDTKDTCPPFCSCFHYAIACTNVLIQPEQLTNSPYISFYLITIDLISLKFLQNMAQTKYLNISTNKLTDVCNSINHMKALVVLDLSNNFVQRVVQGCFKGLLDMKFIILHRNRLTTIEPKSFSRLGDIYLLDLSNNNILTIENNIFYQIGLIYKLKISSNPLTDLKINGFHDIPVANLITEDFHICCIVSANTVCTASPPWYTSCSRLFPNSVIKVFFTLIATLVIILNILSLFNKLWSIHRMKRNVTFYTIVYFVNSGDLFCGMYLSILCTADAFYGGSFIVNDLQWRKHIACYFAFISLFFFSLFMPCTLIFMSMTRLMVVRNPLKSIFKSRKFVFKFLASGAFFFITLSVIITVNFVSIQGIPANMCSPFIDPTDSHSMVKVLTWLVALNQLTSLIVISVIYLFLFVSLKAHVKTVAFAHTKVNSYLVFQLIMVTGSNMIGWFPSSIIFIYSLIMPKYPTNLVMWATVFIIPVNSIINPIIFLMADLRGKKS